MAQEGDPTRGIPTPLPPYDFNRFQELDSTVLIDEGPSRDNYDYNSPANQNWQGGNDYLLENSGIASAEYEPNLDFTPLNQYNSEEYGVQGSRYLPPFLSPTYTPEGSFYDYFDQQAPLASTSSGIYPTYQTAPGQSSGWSYADNNTGESSSRVREREGNSDNNPVYPPASYQLPLVSPSTGTAIQSSTTAKLQPATPATSTSILPTDTPISTGPVYDPYNSTSSNPNPYARLSAAVSSVSTLPFPGATPERTRSLSLLKQPTSFTFPASLTSSYRPSRAALSSESSSAEHKNWQGLYSSSGFDLVGMLARVAARPNAQINIGPVDTKSAFVVCDANQYDQPIIFASETFKDLTGYSGSEILGQNCRFLQSPDGVIVPGSARKHMDGRASFHLKRHISAGKESQTSMINYCKGGRPFINLLTVIPITWDSDEIAFYVGFQVSLAPSAPSRFQRLP